MARRLLDLTHQLRDGVKTHPGLPGPRHNVFRTREQYQRDGGVSFQVDQVDLVGNTGTYLDSPFHRFEDGADLAALPLRAVADLPTVRVDVRDRARREIDIALLERLTSRLKLTGTAILLHTGGDDQWATPAYAEHAPYLSEHAARWLADRSPALVGIDAVNIDDLHDQSRPAHSVLLAAGVLVLEHLTGLRHVPQVGGRLHAAPLPWRGIGTWPVRAYVLVDEDE